MDMWRPTLAHSEALAVIYHSRRSRLVGHEIPRDAGDLLNSYPAIPPQLTLLLEIRRKNRTGQDDGPVGEFSKLGIVAFR